MRWEIHPKGSTIGYAGYAERTPVTEAVSELWLKYIDEVAPKNTEVKWDHLRAEICLDSGRVILFPAASPFRYRAEKAVCQIICPDLLASYEDMIKAGVSDDQFDAWANGATEKVVSLVSGAARQMNLPHRLGKPSVRILYYGADLEKLLREDNLGA